MDVENKDMKEAIRTNVNCPELQDDLSLWKIVGQGNATEILKPIALQYVNDKMEGRKVDPPSVLISGDPGSGRSTIARAFSNAILGIPDFKESVGKTLGLGECLYQYFEESGPDTVFYVKGAEELSNYAQTVIYRLLREQILYVPIRLTQRRRKVEFASKPFLLLSINKDSWLNQELQNVIEWKIELNVLSEEELFLILKRRCKYCGWKHSSDEVPRVIAQNADGNPGRAMRILQMAYVNSRAGDKEIMEIGDVKKAMELLGNKDSREVA